MRKSIEPGNGFHDHWPEFSWPHGKGEGAGRTGPKCFLTSGEVLSKPLRALVALPRVESCILGSEVHIAPHTGCQSWGWMQGKLLSLGVGVALLKASLSHLVLTVQFSQESLGC